MISCRSPRARRCLRYIGFSYSEAITSADWRRSSIVSKRGTRSSRPVKPVLRTRVISASRSSLVCVMLRTYA